MPDTADYTLSPAPWAVLLAAGRGSRMAEAAGCPKQFLETEGVPLFWRSVRSFAKMPRLAGIVFVFPQDQLDEARAACLALNQREPSGLAFRFAAGGGRRQDSVRQGLAQVPASAAFVLVHDAARPFFTPALANRILDRLGQGCPAVIPGIPVTDTVKRVDADGMVAETPPRQALRAVQTPQGFARRELAEAHRAWLEANGPEVTDDAALMEASGFAVAVEQGEASNMKITHPEDLERLQPARAPLPLSGFGYDVHRYGGTRPLKLGGVPIDTELCVEAHSDGDVLLHALMDAILGMAGAGDIGELFPDTDPAFDGIDSAVLLARVLDVARRRKVRVTHADCTVVAQKPKLAPQRQAIRKNLCRLLSLEPDDVAVKATTEERLGFTGEALGLKAYCVVSGIRG